MTTTTNVCRLCLEVVSNNYEKLDSCKEGMLKVISLNLDLALTDTPLICSSCEEILQHAFFFKTSCLSNEDYLKTYLHCDSNIKLTLEEIVQRDTVENEIKCENESVCRFCLKYLDSTSFVKLDNVDDDIFLRDMLYKCLPEIKLGITNKPLMCFVCMENLQNQFNFVITCLDNDEKIKSYMSVNGINNNVQLNLSDVLKFVDSTKNDESAEIDTSLIKLENVTNGIDISCDLEANTEEFIDDSIEIKMEESDASDESDIFDEFRQTPDPQPKGDLSPTKRSHNTNRKQSTVPNQKKKLHKCEQCSFSTVWKSSLNQHVLTHRDNSDAPKFKCAHCPYESKRKKHLKRHSRKHMDVDPKPYKCQYCPWKTGEKWYFKIHYRTKHGKEAPPWEKDCDQCDFKTAEGPQLKNHSITVHNLTAHVCHCGYTSTRLYHFQQHSLRHMAEDEVEMFDCDVCDFKTKYKNSYKTHMNLHKAGKMPRRILRGPIKWKGQKVKAEK